MPVFRYLQRSDIDTARWDTCISSALNSLIYAKSYYLDALATHWHAIVADDYDIVMPLPFRRKYGISYVYMPAFTQQLGCFSSAEIPDVALNEMLLLAQQHLSFGDYQLNYKNVGAGFSERCNYVLSLNQAYTNIKKRYKNDLKKNLTRAMRFDLAYENTNDYRLAIDLFQSLYSNRYLEMKEVDYTHLKQLCPDLLRKEELLVRKVTDGSNALHAIAVCLKDANRLYLILSATTEKGRSLEANHFLLDHLIQEFAAQQLTLDFEGSDRDGIAHFYKNFGSINEPYYFIRWNKLPWPFYYLKKKSFMQLFA